MNGLNKETLDAVEQGIVLQMERLANEQDFTPNDWAQIANAGANLLDKMTTYLQQESQISANQEKIVIEQKRIDIERQKVECDQRKNEIDAEKLKTQKELEEKKIALNRLQVQFEKEAAELRCSNDMAKNKAENGWKKYLIEAAKIGVPAAVSIGTLVIWKDSMHEIMKFEETGKLCTTVANKFMKLPHLNGF